MPASKPGDLVVLVDASDQPLGEMNKLEAHVQGKLHRAFSIFVFNHRGELLLQRRAYNKYHSGGLWSNSCCSHPRPSESVIDAAHRRLDEEMGLTCNLVPAFSFIYRAVLEDGLVEHELDHVLIGHSNMLPTLNEEEVADFRYASMVNIRAELKQDDGRFTAWFRLCFEQVAGILAESAPQHRVAA